MALIWSFELEDLPHFLGNGFEFLDDPDALAGGEMPDAAQQQREQGEDGDLRGEGFGGGDADLRAGVHVDAAVVLAGDGAGDVVANAEGAVALALALAHGGQGIGGLAALADDEDQRVLVHRHVAVAEFAGELDLDRARAPASR